jgi:hypothetical protein
VLASLSKAGRLIGGSFLGIFFRDAESSEKAVLSAGKKFSPPPRNSSPNVDNLLKAHVPKPAVDPRFFAKIVWKQEVAKKL